MKIERKRKVVMRIVSSLLIGLLATAPVSAAAVEREVRLNVVSQPLGDVVETLSFMSGIPVTTVGTLNGKVENWSVKESGAEAFAKLGAVSNLFVAFDGSRMIIAPKQEITTVVFERKGKSWKTVKSAIHAMFPILPEDAIREDQASGLVLVRGPQVFVKAVEDVLSRQETDQIQIIKGGQVEVITPGNGA
jgi:type II secretory pathway component GspD/PulD (secretin)